MSAHLIAGLGTEAASQICRDQCRAMCCRGSLILRLTDNEAATFDEHAAALGVDPLMTRASNGDSWVRFSEHPGEYCPMLDAASFTCRFYEERPQHCRDFPRSLTSGCAISGG